MEDIEIGNLMAEILKTKRIASEIQELISNAKQYVYIFSYSLKIDPIYVGELKAASKRGVGIIIVFGVEPNNKEALIELSSVKGCTIFYKEYLHAKFYYNEETLIIASMNLSDVSEKNNYELGVLFKKVVDDKVFEKIKSEAEEIIGNSKAWPEADVKSPKANKHLHGTCIRCGKSIKLNTEKPLCIICYDEWAEWENEDYHEKYCHSCGKITGNITYARPQCSSCYKNDNSDHIDDTFIVVNYDLNEEWEKWISRKFSPIKFDKTDWYITGNNYLNKGISISTQYGFITFELPISKEQGIRLKEANIESLTNKLIGYRCYWNSPFNRICLYPAPDRTLKEDLA